MAIFPNSNLTAKQRALVESKAHLVVLSGDGSATAIMPGQIIGIVTNPSRADGVLHLVLTKVTQTKLQFISFSKLRDGKEGEKRRITFEITKNEAF